MKKIVLIILIPVIFSCASISNQYSAKLYNSKGKLTDKERSTLGLEISAEEDNKMSSLYFGLIYMTFENRSDKWIRIRNVTLDFGSAANDSVRIVSGKDIVAWKDAISKTITIEEYNRSLVLGTIAILGTSAAIAGSKGELKAAGAVAGIGALTALTVEDYNKYISKIENVKIFPENHLMAEDFSIPPGLFTKKWILLNSTNHKKTGKLTSFKMTYNTDNNITESVKVIFRTLMTNSEWQRDIY